MTRLITFSVVVIALIIAISLDKYKSMPVDNSLFNMKEMEAAHVAHVKEIAELEKKREEILNPVKKTEEVVAEGPLVVLDTPQLVNGSELYKACIVCHGKRGDGKKSQNAPKIGGQMAWYIEKQLVDMKSGERVNKVMMPYLKKLKGNDFKDLAAYIAKLPW